MKTYNAKFDCIIPCEILTTIEAENEEIAIQKILKNEFTNFRYKTKGNLYNITNIKLEESEIQP